MLCRPARNPATSRTVSSGTGIPKPPTKTKPKTPRYTQWFRDFDDMPACFITGRLKFSGAEDSAPFPSAVIYAGRNLERFANVFERKGTSGGQYEKQYQTSRRPGGRQRPHYSAAHQASHRAAVLQQPRRLAQGDSLPRLSNPNPIPVGFSTTPVTTGPISPAKSKSSVPSATRLPGGG